MNNEIKIIDNYLPKETMDYLENFIISNNFPYYYNVNIAGENIKTTDTFMFNHNLMNKNEECSTVGKMITNLIMNNITHKYIYRSKINFYLKTCKIKKHLFHIDDTKLNMQVALFYVNTNNGYTEFKNKTIVNSVRNRLLLFPGKLKHRSTTTTDTRHRVNININFD